MWRRRRRRGGGRRGARAPLPVEPLSVDGIHDDGVLRAGAVEQPKGHARHRQHKAHAARAILEEHRVVGRGRGQRERRPARVLGLQLQQARAWRQRARARGGLWRERRERPRAALARQVVARVDGSSSDASGEELVAAFTPSLWWRYDVDGMTALTRRVRDALR